MRFYVCGPITPRNCTPREASRIHANNVDAGIVVAIQLMEKGHMVFCPHLSYYIHIHPSCTEEVELGYWYAYDNTILRMWAEALYYMGPSPGAELELELAERLGLRIYKNMDDVPHISEMGRR